MKDAFCESSTETGDDSFNLWETMEEEDQPERHFIGFDFSTQQVIKIPSEMEVAPRYNC